MVFERIESTRFLTIFCEKNGNNIIADSEFGSGEVIVDIDSLRWQENNSPLNEDEKATLVDLFKDNHNYYFEDSRLKKNNCATDFKQ